MCAIFGALLNNDRWNGSNASFSDRGEINYILDHITEHSLARGRDGFGWVRATDGGIKTDIAFYRQSGFVDFSSNPFIVEHSHDRVPSTAIIGNFRAEPTTEYVQEKRESDQQPYTLGDWSIVHNGTIANDKELRTGAIETKIDSAALVEQLNVRQHLFNGPLDNYAKFRKVIESVVGSYAILAIDHENPENIMLAANYRPIWYAETELGVFFASAKEYFPTWMTPVALEPYSTALFSYEFGKLRKRVDSLQVATPQKRVLVVASGGLDSTVAAAQLVREGYEVEMIHFTYGCKAEDMEREAVARIGKAMQLNVTFFPLQIYDPEDSQLFNTDSTIAGGEAGAEFAHEWVPARNLVMLSVATAFAEAKGFDFIALGNNLEEAGAYPDNEPEFIRRFNEILPFAVGSTKRIRVLMPVGDLMKHEIVALGIANGAPLHLTWSCYKRGEIHCGTCGPCFMRKTAFEINETPEVISYKNDEV